MHCLRDMCQSSARKDKKWERNICFDSIYETIVAVDPCDTLYWFSNSTLGAQVELDCDVILTSEKITISKFDNSSLTPGIHQVRSSSGFLKDLLLLFGGN